MLGVEAFDVELLQGEGEPPQSRVELVDRGGDLLRCD